jgi:hypothetical protein
MEEGFISMSSPSVPIGDPEYNQALDSRLKHAGMTKK